MNSETPFAGDVPGGDDDVPYEWLDEWLCEYVDGTMDPSLEAVFEQYVEANPELKAHIQRLKETRRLLCECGLPNEPSADVKEDICTEARCDSSSSLPLSDLFPDRPAATFGLVSSVAVALVVGFLVGATVGPTPLSLSTTSPSAPPTESRVSASPSLEPTHDPSRAPTPPLLQLSPSSSDSTNTPSPLTTIGLP